MDSARLIKVSKYLSKHLRHQPQRLGLRLGSGGWVEVDELLAACRAHGFPISRDELHFVVANNDKQRFTFDESGACIRANQGHSVAVDLQLAPAVPPPVLYHGTGAGSVAAILAEGLQKRARHHVHLSSDVETATKVGARHGRPVVLRIDAAAMHAANFEFYVSANHVWLVEHVPPQFLEAQ